MDRRDHQRERPESTIPLEARIRMGHAMVQGIADQVGVDMVHVKGYAVEPGLYRPGRASTDVDIWVRPSQVDRFITALAEHDWKPLTSFRSGSVFEHAAVSHHPLWSYVDIHRVMPGVGLAPEEAFERVWAEHHKVEIADYPCAVPSLDHQRAIIILHEARSGTTLHPDVDHIQSALTEEEYQRLSELASSWKAEVAWAAATNRLEDFQGHPDYPLWKAVHTNARGIALLKARMQTERHWLKRAELVVYAATPNLDHLRLSLHREPTAKDILDDVTQRWGTGLIGLGRQVTTDLRSLFTRKDRR